MSASWALVLLLLLVVVGGVVLLVGLEGSYMDARQCLPSDRGL
jgi:hypothetical protein